MNDSERVQLLNKLLVRVRANAEARPPIGASALHAADATGFVERPEVVEREDELKAWPTAGARTSFPDQAEITDDEGAAIARRIEDIVPRCLSSRPPRGTEPLVVAERGVRSRLHADRWSVLLEDEDAPMASFASDLPPPPKNPTIEEKWRDREPEGALERAVQNAALERASERGAIWVDLVSELRERRGSTSRPSEPEPAAHDPVPIQAALDEEPPFDLSGAAATPRNDDAAPSSTAGFDGTSATNDAEGALSAAFAALPESLDDADDDDDDALPLSRHPTAPPVARSVTPVSARGDDGRARGDTMRPEAWAARPPPDLRRSAAPSSLLPASRRLRRRAQRWTYAKRLVTPRSGRFPPAARAIAFVAAVGIIAVVIAVAWFRNPTSSSAVPPPKRPEAAASSPAVTSTQISVESSPAIDHSTSPAASALPSSSAPVFEGGLTAEEGAPNDTPKLPESQGYLYVSSARKIPVYLNGGMVGETLRWLRVGCGWRYLRLARRGAPPVGSSFPVWATEGRSVLVPCRGATRVDLAEDP